MILQGNKGDLSTVKVIEHIEAKGMGLFIGTKKSFKALY